MKEAILKTKGTGKDGRGPTVNYSPQKNAKELT